MRIWSLYFLLKFGLFHAGYLGFQWHWNLLLACVLAWPIAPGPIRRWRAMLAWPCALALLYHDSYLPTPARVLSQLQALAGFSADYWLELAGRIVDPVALGAFAALVAVYLLASRYIRFATLAFVAILSVPATMAWQEHHTTVASAADPSPSGDASGAPGDGSATADPNAVLQAFYAREAQRRLQFPDVTGKPPFDIVLLHVCSLSWDDMDFVGQRDHPLFKRFDIVFTQFNSAASYSGPASLRVLHGSCGQTPHKALYTGVDPQCLVFPNLEKTGYTTQAVMNHDGVYENFAAALESRGGLAGRIDRTLSAPVHMQNFDGSPIYSDHALLSQWWKKRQANTDRAVALYYNTISLHDGNRVPGMSSRSSLDTFKPRLVQLLSDFDRFITELERSGRPVVVMLVPEHGASLRGDKIQISGMREIPGPRITLVPAAVKLVGMPPQAAPATGPIVVPQPVSYFELNTLLANLLADNPFAPSPGMPLAERLRTLETTRFVSENDDVVVMRKDSSGYWMRAGGNTWIPYAY